MDCELFSSIKELSGRLIERRRRRDHVSQRQLAQAVGRSERWLREIEAGIPTSMLEDHVRCAHKLQMATVHLFIPMLATEHNMVFPRELLLQDDLWDMEEDILAVITRYQDLVLARLAKRQGSADFGSK
jgi:transcriptional regulator with XRE-family HTH domain